MDGTTLCPHCNTRFKILEAQLAAHQGLVRCGHCLQAFDARPGFIPDQPSPQLELPILNGSSPDDEAQHEMPESASPAPGVETAHEQAEGLEPLPVPEIAGIEQSAHDIGTPAATEIEPADATSVPDEEASPEESSPTVSTPTEQADEHLLDFSQLVAAHPDTPAESAPLKPVRTLAEQVAVVEDEHELSPSPAPRKWPWALATATCLLLLAGQAVYFFRVDLAARFPGLKPALVSYCKLLQCSVPLPSLSELMSIESSELEADPALENHITLNALLRNRAIFSQAFPALELTLNDAQDKPLARKVFKPADYLPPIESESFGLLPNHELGIKLHLDVTDMKPTGYRLVLFYPQN